MRESVKPSSPWSLSLSHSLGSKEISDVYPPKKENILANQIIKENNYVHFRLNSDFHLFKQIHDDKYSNLRKNNDFGLVPTTYEHWKTRNFRLKTFKELNASSFISINKCIHTTTTKFQVFVCVLNVLVFVAKKKNLFSCLLCGSDYNYAEYSRQDVRMINPNQKNSVQHFMCDLRPSFAQHSSFVVSECQCKVEEWRHFNSSFTLLFSYCVSWLGSIRFAHTKMRGFTLNNGFMWFNSFTLRLLF